MEVFRNLGDIIESILMIPKVGLKNSRDIIIVAIIILVIMIICAFRGKVVWKNSFIAFDGNEIYYQKKGFFTTEKKQTSIDNITNVTMSANILERMLSVKKVSVDINSVKTAMEDDYFLYLNNSDAIYFIDFVNRIKEKSVDLPLENKLQTQDEKVIYKKEFTNKDSVRHAIFEHAFSFIIIIAILIIAITGIFKDGSGIAIFSIITLIFGNLSSINKEFNFKVLREEKNIKISCGLLSKTELSIPVEKIISVSVNTTLLSLISGYHYLKIQSVGVRDNNTSNNEISLMMKKEDLKEFAEKIIPEKRIYFSAKNKRPNGAFIYTFINKNVL